MSTRMLGDEQSTPNFQTQPRRSTRKSLVIRLSCPVNQCLEEQTVSGDPNVSCQVTDKTTKDVTIIYQSECQKWDELVKEYEIRLNIAKNPTDFPSEKWIKTDPVTRKYFNLLYSRKVFGTYDSLDSFKKSLFETNNDILYELEKLPHLLERQCLFLESLKKKLRLKQHILEDLHFTRDSPVSLLSEFLDTST
ncbi:unnamed protein product [Heterobilharzia americana]|nr:unnamed protein product [Heterobilharzia americana]